MQAILEKLREDNNENHEDNKSFLGDLVAGKFSVLSAAIDKLTARQQREGLLIRNSGKNSLKSLRDGVDKLDINAEIKKFINSIEESASTTELPSDISEKLNTIRSAIETGDEVEGQKLDSLIDLLKGNKLGDLEKQRELLKALETKKEADEKTKEPKKIEKGLLDKFNVFFKFLGAKLGNLLSPITSRLSKLFAPFGKVLGPIFKPLSKLASSGVFKPLASVFGRFGPIAAFIAGANVIGDMGKKLSALFSSSDDKFTGVLEIIRDGAKKFASMTVGILLDGALMLGSWIAEKLGIESLSRLLDKLSFDKIYSFIDSGFEFIGEGIGSIISGAMELPGIIKKDIDLFISEIMGIKDNIIAMFLNDIEWVKETFTSIGDSIKSAFDSILGIGDSIKEALLSVILKLPAGLGERAAESLGLIRDEPETEPLDLSENTTRRERIIQRTAERYNEEGKLSKSDRRFLKAQGIEYREVLDKAKELKETPERSERLRINRDDISIPARINPANLESAQTELDTAKSNATTNAIVNANKTTSVNNPVTINSNSYISSKHHDRTNALMLPLFA